MNYPIRKRGEKRRLQPNRDGIQWLESNANDWDDTDIAYSEVMSGTDKELNIEYAHGYEDKGNVRPMFQIISRDAFSGAPQEVYPCEACYDFHKAWNCPDHPESGPPLTEYPQMNARLARRLIEIRRRRA